MYDMIIVGGGPAGLTAAIYAGRASKSALIIEKAGFGGQMTHSPKIENYPGYKEISGNELADLMFEQALALGADIEIDEVTEVVDLGDVKKVKTTFSEFEGRTVIYAAGVKHRTLGVPGEEERIGNGISFCAVCDGAFYAGKDIAVIGGGNSAMQEAIMLSEQCRSVTMIQDMPYLTGEAALAKIIEEKENIKVITDAKVLSFEGEEGVSAVHISHNGAEQTVPCGGCFIAIGLIPSNQAAAGVAELDKYGYIISDEKCLTKSRGIFVAGDCRTKSIRQITTAAADGATAALAACRYIEGR